MDATYKIWGKVDETPGVVVCIVPDQVYKNCRMKSTIPVKDRVDSDGVAAKELKRIAAELADAQGLLFPEEDQEVLAALTDFEFSPDFRRHLKAKVMPYGTPVQIIKESTLEVTQELAAGEPGTNPLSDRLWNLSVALAYKTGHKPWKLGDAREGVCYVGIAFKKADGGERDACCAAQMCPIHSSASTSWRALRMNVRSGVLIWNTFALEEIAVGAGRGRWGGDARL